MQCVSSSHYRRLDYSFAQVLDWLRRIGLVDQGSSPESADINEVPSLDVCGMALISVDPGSHRSIGKHAAANDGAGAVFIAA